MPGNRFLTFAQRQFISFYASSGGITNFDSAHNKRSLKWFLLINYFFLNFFFPFLSDSAKDVNVNSNPRASPPLSPHLHLPTHTEVTGEVSGRATRQTHNYGRGERRQGRLRALSPKTLSLSLRVQQIFNFLFQYLLYTTWATLGIILNRKAVFRGGG